MKRKLALALALAMGLSLAACGRKEENPAPAPQPAPSAPVEEDISLAELNVEFVAGSRDTAQLMKLKGEFPDVFQKALAEFDVDVEKVNVTFGASADATAQALAAGDVQVGFLPVAAYIAAGERLRVVATREPNRMGEELLGLYIPIADHTVLLREAFSACARWEELVATHRTELMELPIAVPEGDEVALRFLSLMGLAPEKCGNLIAYERGQETEVLSGASLMVCYGTQLLDEGQLEVIDNSHLSGEVVAVGANSNPAAEAPFVAALRSALEQIALDTAGQQMLARYNGGAWTMYHPVDDGAFDRLRFLLEA